MPGVSFLDWVEVWLNPGQGVDPVQPRVVCMYALETSEGPAVSGWIYCNSDGYNG